MLPASQTMTHAPGPTAESLSPRTPPPGDCALATSDEDGCTARQRTGWSCPQKKRWRVSLPGLCGSCTTHSAPAVKTTPAWLHPSPAGLQPKAKSGRLPPGAACTTVPVLVTLAASRAACSSPAGCRPCRCLQGISSVTAA